ncbi:MAG TPA: hypothetical protein VMV49_09220 [Candidatus Deferrimicrobium sp.]|nr:hypothetical protein [Candidatus Deferrimicrobium sp.]
MVKHPKYQAMDNAREWEIPEAFKKYSTNEYEIKRREPIRTSEPVAGPIPRPNFEIFDKNGKLIAEFNPNGYSECFDEKFRSIYEKMVKSIEEAAQRGFQEYMKFETGKPYPQNLSPIFLNS